MQNFEKRSQKNIFELSNLSPPRSLMLESSRFFLFNQYAALYKRQYQNFEFHPQTFFMYDFWPVFSK